MKRIFSIFLTGLLAVAGCATRVIRNPQLVGKPIAKVGEFTGNVGAVILATGGIHPLLIPVGVIIGGSIFLLGYPVYAGGCWIAGDVVDTYPSGF